MFILENRSFIFHILERDQIFIRRLILINLKIGGQKVENLLFKILYFNHRLKFYSSLRFRLIFHL